MKRKADNTHSSALAFSIVASLLIIGFLAYVNFSTGSRFPWFVFPAVAVIWWPLGIFFAGRQSLKVFSLIGSLVIIALLVSTNYLTSWDYPWFIYPSFAVIWWPMSVFMVRPRSTRVYAVLGAMVILVFLAADNMLNCPSCPWTLLTVFPIVLWPLCAFLGKRARGLGAALPLSAAGIAYYIVLNRFVFPGFPWAIFPAYALLWWPLTSAFAGRGRAMLLSLSGTLLSAALFITLNAITTPHVIWAVYPIFLLVWWPLSVYYFVFKPRYRTKEQCN